MSIRSLGALLLLLGAYVAAGCDTSPPTSTSPASTTFDSSRVVVRVNQLGYRPPHRKVAIAFSHRAVEDSFSVVDEQTDQVVSRAALTPIDAEIWGTFAHYYRLDFSDVTAPGSYHLEIGATGDRSPSFPVGTEAYGTYQDTLLAFMRQQRCGYNPFLDEVCHQRDGRSFYGPMPDSTFVDASGGWHDAGDQLKYLLTASNATARMLLAYEQEPEKFGDAVDRRGRPSANDVPDVLDEVRWGLRWLHKLHPKPHHLYHQVADDRDHIGWKWPSRDSSDYGWGPDSYRPVYFATGTPQGLGAYESEATGIGNLAGRYAAAMAMAAQIWRERGEMIHARRALDAAKEVYEMGRANEGFQQGNSYGAPYRYNERTWADDMEWGAAELYAATDQERYRKEAKRYARQIGATSWMSRDSTEHYEYYPFVNVGHFALYPHVGPAFQDTLASYYREGLDAARKRSRKNPYRIGVPFLWCSNNLVTALITQGLLYEKMTGDRQYRPLIAAQRDWLFGRNPWGTSMFTGIPGDGEYPLDVHTSVWALTHREAPGGLVDGPVYRTIYDDLAGLELNEPDEFAPFQTDHVVYHDDIGDYSTNEPTMDGTAGAVYMMAHFGTPVSEQ